MKICDIVSCYLFINTQVSHLNVAKKTLNQQAGRKSLMTPLQTYNVLIKCFLLTGIVFFSACGGDNIVKEKPPNLSGIEKILILPFKDMAGVFGENLNGRCPVCGKVFTTGEVAESAASMLTEHLFILLKDRKDIELIPSSQAQGVMSGLLAGSNKTLREQDLQLEADLLADPKELAEHLMLIDLGRNDIGRVAKTGSVELVEDLFLLDFIRQI